MDLAHASVGTLMTREVVTLTPNHALPLAGEIMRRGRFRHLPVVDSGGALVGMITHRDILAGQTSTLASAAGGGEQLAVRIAEVMSRDVRTCNPLTAAHLAAQILVEHKIGALPVVEDGVLVGIVTEADFVAFAARELGGHQRIEVDDIMTTLVVTLAPDCPLDLAADLIELQRVRHLPVVDEHRRVVGMVTHRDLVEAQRSVLDDGRRFPRTAVASEIARPDVWTVATGTAVREAARLLADHKFGCLPVVSDGELVGVITEADILSLIVRMVARRGTARTRPIVAHYISQAHFVGRDQSVAEARRHMDRAGVWCLAVVSDRGIALGVISAVDLLDADPHDRVASHMTRGAVTVDRTAGVRDAAAALVERDIHQVFAVDGDPPRIVGVLDAAALFAVVRDLRVEQPIGELTRPTLFTIDAGETADAALGFLEQIGVRGLVVEDGDVPVGVVSQLDLLRGSRFSAEAPVERVMSQRFARVSGDTPLFRAAGQAAALGLDRLLVSTSRGWGVVTGVDLAAAIVSWL
jgi:CBS domain-containing membrane protein